MLSAVFLASLFGCHLDCSTSSRWLQAMCNMPLLFGIASYLNMSLLFGVASCMPLNFGLAIYFTPQVPINALLPHNIQSSKDMLQISMHSL